MTIDGQLLGEYVIAAESYCMQALASGNPISLVLRDVSAIDDRARQMLRRLLQRGVQLLGMDLYTSHVVKTLERDEELSSLSAAKRAKG